MFSRKTMQVEGNPNPGGQPRELNLQQMASQFMAGVQRHFDILAFNLAARSQMAEKAYDERCHQLGAMPVVQLHQNFEQMQAHVRDLLNRQVLNDSLNLANSVLNNSHLFLAVVRASKAHPGEQQVINAEVQAAQNEFVKAPFDQRFDKLETGFKVMCELEDSIISMGFCLQALMQQGGRIRPAQLDGQGELRLELLKGESGAANLLGVQQRELLESEEKILREGDLVNFSESELQSLLLTVAAFAHDLFQSVARYAKGDT